MYVCMYVCGANTKIRFLGCEGCNFLSLDMNDGTGGPDYPHTLICDHVRTMYYVSVYSNS